MPILLKPIAAVRAEYFCMCKIRNQRICKTPGILKLCKSRELKDWRGSGLEDGYMAGPSVGPLNAIIIIINLCINSTLISIKL